MRPTRLSSRAKGASGQIVGCGREVYRMDMDFVFRIAGIGILTSVIGIVLTRAGREDVAMLTTLSGLVVVLLMVVNMLAGFFDSVRAVFQLS